MTSKRDQFSWAVWGGLIGLIVGRMCYDSFASMERILTCLYLATGIGAAAGFALASYLNKIRADDR